MQPVRKGFPKFSDHLTDMAPKVGSLVRGTMRWLLLEGLREQEGEYCIRSSMRYKDPRSCKALKVRRISLYLI